MLWPSHMHPPEEPCMTASVIVAGVVMIPVSQHAYVCWVYGDSTSGQAAVHDLGLTGIPIVNVNNNCSTGSSALFLARQYIKGGLAECALAVGFEKMEKGSLG